MDEESCPLKRPRNFIEHSRRTWSLPKRKMFDTLAEVYETLRENGIDVYCVKTDALTIKRDDVAKALKLLKGEDEKHKIGGWRVGNSKGVRLPTDEYKLKYNELINPPQPTSERLNIEDEWDTDKI